MTETRHPVTPLDKCVVIRKFESQYTILIHKIGCELCESEDLDEFTFQIVVAVIRLDQENGFVY